jgi:hypothetical protein
LRCVFHGFAASELSVAGVEINRRAAQLLHPRLKRQAGAGGAFLENHHQGAVCQGVIGLIRLEALLDDAGALENVIQLVQGQIFELQKVFDAHNF